MWSILERVVCPCETVVSEVAAKLKQEGLTSLTHSCEPNVQVPGREVVVTGCVLAASGIWPDQRRHNTFSPSSQGFRMASEALHGCPQ